MDGRKVAPLCVSRGRGLCRRSKVVSGPPGPPNPMLLQSKRWTRQSLCARTHPPAGWKKSCTTLRRERLPAQTSPTLSWGTGGRDVVLALLNWHARFAALSCEVVQLFFHRPKGHHNSSLFVGVGWACRRAVAHWRRTWAKTCLTWRRTSATGHTPSEPPRRDEKNELREPEQNETNEPEQPLGAQASATGHTPSEPPRKSREQITHPELVRVG